MALAGTMGDGWVGEWVVSVVLVHDFDGGVAFAVVRVVFVEVEHVVDDGVLHEVLLDLRRQPHAKRTLGTGVD